MFLPKILERFARESSLSSDDLLKWITENVDKKLHDSIWKCINSKSSKKVSQIMEWLPYSSRFRYVFSTDLTDKPWWVWDLFEMLEETLKISFLKPLTMTWKKELVAYHIALTCNYPPIAFSLGLLQSNYFFFFLVNFKVTTCTDDFSSFYIQLCRPRIQKTYPFGRQLWLIW